MRSSPPRDDARDNRSPGNDPDRLNVINRKLDEIAAALAVIAGALTVMVPVKRRDRMPNEKAEALKAKVREKKTVFEGLVAARDALEAKLNEAKNSTDMGETNAAIDEAISMLDAFVDPAAKASVVLEGTEAANVPAEAAQV